MLLRCINTGENFKYIYCFICIKLLENLLNYKKILYTNDLIY